MPCEEWNQIAIDMRRELAWCFVMAKWGYVFKSNDLQRQSGVTNITHGKVMAR